MFLLDVLVKCFETNPSELTKRDKELLLFPVRNQSLIIVYKSYFI